MPRTTTLAFIALTACAAVACGATTSEKSQERGADVALPSAPPPPAALSVPPRPPLVTNLMLVIDASGSMNARFGDTEETRFDVAKRAAVELTERRAGGLVGAVLFGKEAFYLEPLVEDPTSLDEKIEKLKVGVIDPSGTAMGEGVLLAVKALRAVGEPREVVVLTDGSIEASAVDPAAAGDYAKNDFVRVSFVQLADRDLAVLQDGVDLFGAPRMIEAKMPIDVSFLDGIAKPTGGERIVSTDASSVRDAIAHLQRVLDLR